MPDRDAVLLAQALCSRLCHDLAGPLGAIGSGAELLEEDAGETDGEIIDLLSRSAAAASGRLRVCRALLGQPTSRSHDPTEARGVLTEHLAMGSGSHAPELSWRVSASGPDERVRPMVQVLLTLTVVALEAMPRHDRIAVNGTLPGTCDIQVSGAAPVRQPPLEALAAGLDNRALISDPRNIMGYYAGLLAHDLGARVRVESLPGTLHVSLHTP
ncbi:histidine phosphotransferase family protein [uncultured Rhodospira sp.]|uniref:histidine phosphotransferase family protein n=1 Tax=uncultured Rhodospira sp. TaxID=1936189 RepID=UPI00262F7D7A|nr:histidine phosphotransferase family protein [uncultured Rhodospira sp.]